MKTYGNLEKVQAEFTILALESMLVSVNEMKCFISTAPFIFAGEHFWFIYD